MKSCAYIVGADDGPANAVARLAREAGIEDVQPFRSVGAAERQAALPPVCFFLFAPVENPRELAAAAQAIRFCPRRLRFSPLIYFSQGPSLETIRLCIEMGFDDIVTLPVTRQRVRERLSRQLDSTLVYYETATYFGPDRRGRVNDGSSLFESRGQGHYRRLEITRSLERGISVLRDDRFMAA